MRKRYVVLQRNTTLDFSQIDEKDWMNELELDYRDDPRHVEMKNLITISSLCRSLSESGKFFCTPKLID